MAKNKVYSYEEFVYYEKMLDHIINKKIVFCFDKYNLLQTENTIFEKLENSKEYQNK